MVSTVQDETQIGRIAPERHAARSPTGVAFDAVYNVLYWPYLLSSCVLLFLPAVLIWAASLRDERRRLLHQYTCLWASHYLALAPRAGVKVEGLEQARESQPCIFVSNHQSMVDILAVFATRLPFLWVSKIENFYAPFLGWNMIFNRYIPLRRGHLPSIMRMVRTCNRRLREGHNLFVFPEGTRSPDGELKHFYPGAFRLAARNRVPVVPVIIEGTGDILPKNSFRIRPRPVHVRILAPVHPDTCGNDHRALHDRVRAMMQRELDRLRGRVADE